MSDSDVEMVLRHLGPSWTDLAPQFGFSEQDVENFCRTCVDLTEAADQMLREWKTQNGHKATLFSLLAALEQAGRKDIADELVAVRMCGDGIAI